MPFEKLEVPQSSRVGSAQSASRDSGRGLRVVVSALLLALSVSRCAEEGEPLRDGSTRTDVRSDISQANRDGMPSADVRGAMDVLDQDADPEPDIDAAVVEFDAPDFDVPTAVMDVPNGVRADAPNPLVDVRVTDSGRPVLRTIGYRMATYTQRGNWVLDCARGYAYTAQGGDHILEDCDRLFAPDRTLRGTATFLFRGVIPSNYDVVIASRFSMNRDPAGALFLINGRAFMPIDQRPGNGIVNTTLTRAMLVGDVTVVLDNSRAPAGSDSVQSVTLRPAP